ncbi:MAG: DUF4276 family protein [Kofleriaceae bacterium]
MIRLVVVVEGQTEEAFVNEVLGPHLAARQVFTSPMIVATRRDPRTGAKSKGGGRRWAKWRNDIDKVLRTEASPQSRVTTLFDLYALPSDFPGADEHGRPTPCACELAGGSDGRRVRRLAAGAVPAAP